MSAAEVATTQSSSTPSKDNSNNNPELFKSGHVAQISLHTFQDVAQAKAWIKSPEFETRPILSDLKITFRALYDKPDGTTTVHIARKVLRPDPNVGNELALSVCLGLKGLDLIHKCIPARVRNVFDEAANNGGTWIARLLAIESKNLQEGGYATLQYYSFFKEIALRKEGREWDIADLELVIDFLADRRGR